MKLETILQAAKNSMINGHHVAHCFSAHVVGEGYTNRGEHEHNHADYLRQLERSVQSEIDNMGYATDYAEPGYDKPERGILFANWNSFPRNFDSILEKVGYAVEWSDEWSTCEGCNRAYRISPDSYGWKRSYVTYDDGSELCSDCVRNDLDEYQEYLLNNSRHADTLDIDWSERGFTKFNADSYENGFHPGQNDDPKKIAKQVPKDHDFLFAIPSVGQFDIRFDCWIKAKDSEEI